MVGCLGIGGTESVEGNMSEGSSEDRRLLQVFDFLLVAVGCGCSCCGGTGSPLVPLLLLFLP